MQIKLYASLRQTAGVKMVEVDFQPGITMGAILHELTRRYPILIKAIWKEQDVLSDQVHVFLNGVDIRHLAGLDTRPAEQDHVDIFPPLVGGR
jgi:molybdopterin synthase sulfur carrier subunit